MIKILWIFGLMLVPAVCVADDVCKDPHNRDIECIDKLIDSNGENSCGTNCLYNVVTDSNGDSVLHVYKKDASIPATIKTGAFSPNFYADGVVKDAGGNALPLTNIMLDNDFERIGDYAFAQSGAQISSASGKFVFTKAGSYIAFGGSTTFNGDVYFNKNVAFVLESSKVNGDVVFTDGVTGVENYVTSNANINGNIIIPNSVQEIGLLALTTSSLTGKIYCASGAEACYEMIKNGCENSNREDKIAICLSRLEKLFNSKKFEAYPDGCDILGVGAFCTKCTNTRFRLTDGKCNRVIYTIDEANQAAGSVNRVSIKYR